MTVQGESYRLHLACLSAIGGGFCTTCDRQAPEDVTSVREAKYGWRHIPCGLLVVDRDGRPWCEGRDCNYFVDLAEMVANDPASPRRPRQVDEHGAAHRPVQRRHAPTPDDLARLSPEQVQAVFKGCRATRGDEGAGDHPVTSPRQPAYDAVIRQHAPRSTDDYGHAAENGRVWHAVEEALDATGASRLWPLHPRFGPLLHQVWIIRPLQEGPPMLCDELGMQGKCHQLRPVGLSTTLRLNLHFNGCLIWNRADLGVRHIPLKLKVLLDRPPALDGERRREAAGTDL